ncbi:hypothetical protein NDU88_001503 [Pleurodeles waltl]|uniref:Osteopontin n=1 Tax=Pleurodeles waltl TaxID=8319 RepID=A0AAV7W0F5_PLEWA|nr:hypothetical protein NDU88_001503 [Pleurodeles waltl]
MNMKIVVLCLCLLGVACAVPTLRSRHSFSSEDISQDSSKDLSSESHDRDSDSSEEVHPVATTTVLFTEAYTDESYTEGPFNRGDNTGRGDSNSIPFEVIAADDKDHPFNVKNWKSTVRNYKRDLQALLDATSEQANEADDADKVSADIDDTNNNDATSHQHTTSSKEHNSKEDDDQSLHGHSVEEDAHQDSLNSNESPETQPDHSVEADSHPDTPTSNESPEQHVQLRGLKQVTVEPYTESSESSESHEDSLPHESIESYNTV